MYGFKFFLVAMLLILVPVVVLLCVLVVFLVLVFWSLCWSFCSLRCCFAHGRGGVRVVKHLVVLAVSLTPAGNGCLVLVLIVVVFLLHVFTVML